ncbi:MAG: helix-turn-helix domain-containing protein, partial [Dehalococcoidia bacterium]|nr:helix-turn-helix domain-containing protein [Dehalococcoidia bacterium]
PDVAISLLELVGTRLRLIEERLLESAYSPVAVRLAHFLLTNMGKDSQLVTGFKQIEIADSIGAVRQTVGEALNLMQRQGILKVEPKRIRVLLPHRLKEIADS